MCGIFGMVSEKWQAYAGNAARLLAHRGPDDSGSYLDYPLSLFHYRLAILDLSSNGHQPMVSEDGRFVIVINGEIYNHLEIRDQLKHKTFRSSSDTETLLYAFEAEDTGVFNKLNGIFALVIYDAYKKELILARDHLGVKPLYFHDSEDGFVFSSELKSISVLPGMDKSLDVAALLNYVQFMYSPGRHTPFASIKKFDPGHYMRYSIGERKVLEYQSYYQIPFTGAYLDKGESYWIDRIDQELRSVIGRQLLSDVPVGYFISGGLDSSLIAAISKNLQPEKTLTGFTIRHSDQSKRDGFADDFPYALKVSEILSIDLHVVDGRVDPEKDLEDLIWQLDEPQTEISAWYVDSISRLARERGYYVLLSGMGGDDLFAGYRRHLAARYDYYFFKLPYALRKLFAGAAEWIYVKKASFRRLKKYLEKFSEKEIQAAIVNYYYWLQTDKALSLFEERYKEELQKNNATRELQRSLQDIPDERNSLNQMLYWDMRYFLPDHNLNYTDKMSMKHAVEVRVPFCDPGLVNLSTLIPPVLKNKNGISKYLLKKVAERYLPKDIIYRPKTGFGGPLRQWITNDFKNLIDVELNVDKLNLYSIFDPAGVRKLIGDNLSGKVDAAYPIFAILAIQAWMKRFITK